jgi:hypothetical protein
MWGTDMTTTVTREDGQVAICIAVDHCAAECVGIHAAKSGTRFEALEPIRQGVRTSFGGFGKAVACGVRRRHEHGSQYMSPVCQEEGAFLGIESSPALVREPQGHGWAERFLRTLKENVLWLTPCDTVEERRVALREFKATYNATWRIGRHGDKTPAQGRQAQLVVRAKQAA